MHKSTTQMQNQLRAQIQQCTNEKCTKSPHKCKTSAGHEYNNTQMKMQKMDNRIQNTEQFVKKSQKTALPPHYCCGLVETVLA